MKSKTLLCLLFAITSLAGCSGTACTDSVEPGFVITVYDKENMAPLCGVNIMLLDGEYVETNNSPENQECDENDARLYMAFERKGNYQITASLEGYKTWTSDEVAVLADRCHVIRNQVDILLEKL